MRAAFVLGTLLLALVLGIFAALSGSRVVVATLTIGFMPVIWGASRLIDRVTGRGMWHFSAPYPYRWMREAGDAAKPASRHPATQGEPPPANRDVAPLPIAA